MGPACDGECERSDQRNPDHVSRNPFSMMQNNSPSLSHCVAAWRMSGGFG